MDPSKFSVRVTNPTMIRQERFSDFAGLNIPKLTPEYIGPIHCKRNEKNSASWCAPRRVHPVGSSASIGDDSSEKEARTTNLRNVRRWARVSQHARRIEELSRPRCIVRRLPRSQNLQSKIATKLVNQLEITNSETEVTAKPLAIAEKQFRRRQLTDRISKLAEPKVHESVAVNPLGKVDERALFAVASKRISELATPKNLSSLQNSTTEKRYPFGVNPQALKATCTPRIELLARPKKFPSLSTPMKRITSENVRPIGTSMRNSFISVT